jgi:hypothetical protein
MKRGSWVAGQALSLAGEDIRVCIYIKSTNIINVFYILSCVFVIFHSKSKK